MNRQLLRRSPERSSQWRWRSLLLALLCLLCLPSEAQNVDESQVITLSTTRQAGQTIQLEFILRGDIRIEGAEAIDPEAIPHNSWEKRTYRLTQSTVRVIGNLKSFSCSGNNVTAVDVSQSRTLESFSCDHNELTELDLSRNAALTYLECTDNQLTQLSVAHNETLQTLLCSRNKLVSLSLPSNGMLEWLECRFNLLKNLDLRGQAHLKYLRCESNVLTRLDINSSAPLLILQIDGNRMSKEAMDHLVAQLPQIDIPEERKRYQGLFIAVDTKARNEYNHLSRASASQATNKGWQVRDRNGAALGGSSVAYEGSDEPINKPNYALLTFAPDIVGQEIVIEFYSPSFSRLHPYFEGAQLIRKEERLGQYTLYHLRVDQSHVRIDDPHALVLKDLEALTRVDLSKSSDLNFLEITNAPNFKQGLDLRPNSKLRYVKLSNIGIAGLELNQSGELSSLRLDSLTLPSLNLSHQNNLFYLTLKGVTLSSEINCTDLSTLHKITCEGGSVAGMTVRNCPQVKELFAPKSQLKRIEVENTPKLWMINLQGNQLEELDMSKLNGSSELFVYLYANHNRLKRFVAGRWEYNALFVNNNELEELDLSTAKAVKALSAHINKLKSIRLNPEAPIFFASVMFNNLDLAAMSAFINALPHYKEPTEKDNIGDSVKARIDVKGFHPQIPESNRISKALVEQLKAKDWIVTYYEDGKFKDEYEGDDASEVYYAITSEYDSSVGSISLSASDPSRVPAGTEVYVTVAPAEGYELASLTANGTDITVAKRFTLEGNTTVRATFRKRTYSVAMDAPEHGTIHITGASDLTAVPHGTTLSVEVSPEEGYELATLTANGEDIKATKTFVVTSDTGVEATFRQKPVVVKTYAVRLEAAQGGTIGIEGKTTEELEAVEEGTVLSVTATPSEGYELATLTANGTDIKATKTFTVSSDTRVVATFRQKPVVVKTYAVTLEAAQGGTIGIEGKTPEELEAVEEGTVLSVTTTPAEGYELATLTANGTDIKGTKLFVVDSDTRVVATFEKYTFGIQLPEVDHAKVAIKGNPDLTKIAYGTELELEITPDEGYEVEEVKVNGQTLTAPYRFRVDGEISIMVKMKQRTYQVLQSVEGEGTLNITGASDLQAVVHGTQLSVTATPAEGYELATLTANGTDIKTTKTFAVSSDTRVEARFEKRTFAVKIPEVDHTKVAIKGNPDLTKIAYGTELELEITPDEGYEVEEVKVNGQTLTAPYRFSVDGEINITVKMKNVSVVIELKQASVRLYPNPAISYLIVEGVEEGEPLRLINLAGRVVLEQRQNASGHLNVSHLVRGIYLLQVQGTTHRVILH